MKCVNPKIKRGSYLWIINLTQYSDVIGSGAIGLSVANELVQQSLNITLISPRQQDGVASLAAGAIVDAFGEIETLDSDQECQKLHYEVKAQSQYPE